MVRVWRVNHLIQELRVGKVSERDKLHYVFASAALHYLVGPVSLLSSPNWQTLAWSMVGMVMAFLGLTLAFAANGGEGGHSFIERYLCLSLPILVRTYLFGYLVYYAGSITAVALSPTYREQVSAQRLVSDGFGLCLFIVYFAWLYRALTRVAAPAAT